MKSLLTLEHCGFRRLLPHAALFSLVISASAAAAAPHTELAFFESKIRPLFSEHCYSCHSAAAEKLKGGLHLDSLDGLLKGGDSGPAIVPGDPERSLLMKAVRYNDPDLQMPPKEKKLSSRQIADLAHWIKAGAAWPPGETAAVSHTPKTPLEITDRDRRWWAFQPIVRPSATRPSGNKRRLS